MLATDTDIMCLQKVYSNICKSSGALYLQNCTIRTKGFDRSFIAGGAVKTVWLFDEGYNAVSVKYTTDFDVMLSYSEGFLSNGSDLDRDLFTN